jgi:hypothetical protein
VSWSWAVRVTPINAALRRNLGLCRHARRRVSIEHTARDHTGVIRIGHRTAEGGLPCIEVWPPNEGTPELDLRCAAA